MTLSSPDSPARRGVLEPAIVAPVAALAAASLLIAVFQASKIVSVLLIGALAFAVLFTTVRNQRLFCLWGAILTAPLAISKSFVVIAHMGGAGAYTLEPLDLFLVLLLAFMARDLSMGARPKIRWSPVTFWWGGMIVLGLLSVCVGPLRQVSAEEVVRMLKCLLLFLVILNECLRRRQIMTVVAALVACIAIQSGAALIQGAFHANLHLQVLGEATPEAEDYTSDATYGIGGGGVFRASGLLGHANLVAAFLSMLLPICFALLLARIPLIWKSLLAVVTAMGSLALVITLSRTSWLTFAVGLAILFLFSLIHPRLRTRFVFARFAVLGLLAITASAFSGTIAKRLFESDPGALKFRYEWNQVAWDMGLHHPFLGVGLNTFVFNLPGETKYGGVAGLNEHFGPNWPTAHNIYLVTWAEQGALGVVFLVGLFLYLFYIGLKNATRYIDDALFSVNMGCFAGAVSMSIDGLSSFYLRNPAPARVFWIFAGLMVAIDYWNRANRPLAAQTPRSRGSRSSPSDPYPDPAMSADPA